MTNKIQRPRKTGMERRLQHASRALKRNCRPKIKDGRLVNRPIIEIATIGLAARQGANFAKVMESN
jgi:hypothetical protein